MNKYRLDDDDQLGIGGNSYIADILATLVRWAGYSLSVVVAIWLIFVIGHWLGFDG